LTTVQPARRIPASATGYCITFGIMIATRLPLPNPRLCSQAASAAEYWSSWLYVISTPMKL
jgi:hypothetical protein